MIQRIKTTNAGIIIHEEKKGKANINLSGRRQQRAAEHLPNTIILSHYLQHSNKFTIILSALFHYQNSHPCPKSKFSTEP